MEEKPENEDFIKLTIIVTMFNYNKYDVLLDTISNTPDHILKMPIYGIYEADDDTFPVLFSTKENAERYSKLPCIHKEIHYKVKSTTIEEQLTLLFSNIL
jgi:hypothetical protein